MFGRNKYPKVVAAAREVAKRRHINIIVYQEGRRYNWCIAERWSYLLTTSTQPVIRLLLCLPDGTLVQ